MKDHQLSANKDRIIKQNRILAYWTSGWMLTMALATFGPKFLWNFNSWLTGGAILINLLFGIGLIMGKKKWLKQLDELQLKIQLDAMAMALGVGIVGGLSYSLMDITNLIPMDAEISVLVIAISLTYLAGSIIGTRRYE